LSTSQEAELLTIGRISIDLYCGELGADWHAARSFTKAVGESPANVAIAAARPSTSRVGVPVLWISGGSLCSEPSASTVEAMLRARMRKRHTILDLDYRPRFWRSREEASARLGAAIAYSTYAVGNREECEVAVGTADPHEAARRLMELGVELAIVKLGGDGVLFAR
jgi:sugar/nucleoside kinase (ribokinase family)